MAKMNPRIDSPPKINMINNTKIIVNDVLMVLDMVELIDLFTISLKLPLVFPHGVTDYGKNRCNKVLVDFHSEWHVFP